MSVPTSSLAALKNFLQAAALWIRKYLAKPAIALPLFVIVSREMEEFYPISHFPMYATIDTRPVWYIYLGDADEIAPDGFPAPVPMEHLVGVRPARAKKIYQTRLKDHAADLDLGKDAYYDLPQTEWEAVGKDLLEYFRGRVPVMAKLHAQRGLSMPENLALVFAEITIVPGEPPQETRRLITQEVP